MDNYQREMVVRGNGFLLLAAMAMMEYLEECPSCSARWTFNAFQIRLAIDYLARAARNQ